MSRATWLVHRIRSPGAASRRRTARAAAASMTCSQLSRITNAELALSRSNSAASPPGPSTALTSTSSTSSAVMALSSLASQTPSVPTVLDAASMRPTAIATAVLPMPPGPTISTSRFSLSESDDRRHLDVAADELGRQRRQVARRPHLMGLRRREREGIDIEQRVLGQDPLLELAAAGAGVETELVGQLGPDPLVGRQRVGLAPGSVQRGDQQLPQALLVRSGRHRRLQLADHARRARRAATAPRTGSRRA